MLFAILNNVTVQKLKPVTFGFHAHSKRKLKSPCYELIRVYNDIVRKYVQLAESI